MSLIRISYTALADFMNSSPKSPLQKYRLTNAVHSWLGALQNKII
jgi:hypothetical protein